MTDKELLGELRSGDLDSIANALSYIGGLARLPGREVLGCAASFVSHDDEQIQGMTHLEKKDFRWLAHRRFDEKAGRGQS